MKTTIDFDANSEDRVNLFRLKQLFHQETDSQMIHVSIRLMAFLAKTINRENVSLLLGEFGRGGGFDPEQAAVDPTHKNTRPKKKACAAPILQQSRLGLLGRH